MLSSSSVDFCTCVLKSVLVLFSGLIISWCVEYLFGISAMAFFLMHVLLWFLIDYTLLSICQNGQLPFSKFEFLCAWLLRECSSSYLCIQAHMTTVIVWRHRKYRLRWGGTIEEIWTISHLVTTLCVLLYHVTWCGSGQWAAVTGYDALPRISPPTHNS